MTNSAGKVSLFELGGGHSRVNGMYNRRFV